MDLTPCVVPNCQSTSKSGISMHKFPEDKARTLAWITKIFNEESYRDMNLERICSVHFKSNDYELVCGEKVLKSDAVPSLFLVNSCPSKKIKKENICDFGMLPDLILIEVFNYLSFKDKRSAACVCRNWCNVSKSASLWTQVRVNVKNSLHLLKFLLKLPPSVSYLNIYCDRYNVHHSLWFPDILTRLNESCPEIKTVIIENVSFSKRFCNAGFTIDYMLNPPEIFEQRKANLTNMCRKKFKKINRDKYVPDNRPQKLSTLSLRYTRSFMSHLSSQLSLFFPDIKVLDLTCSALIRTAAVPFFLNLLYLEELYLVESYISNVAIASILKHLNKLKVLDLEGSRGVDHETFEIICMHGHLLEKLFLGNTNVGSFNCSEVSLQNLQTICFKNAVIRETDIFYLLNCPKLKYIYVNFCAIENFSLVKDIATESGRQFIHTNEGNASELCHHFKTKYT